MAVGAMDRLDSARAAIAALFDGQAAVGVTDPRDPQPAPMGREGAHLAQAVASRRAEFAAGRAAARQAMRRLGLAPAEIAAGSDRAPVWPSGLSGSITHTSCLCAAVISDRPLLLGIDLEQDVDLNPALLPTICSPSEIARIEGAKKLRLGKLIFSAKEAAYKAQYPVTRRVFGFDHMDVTLDLSAKRFIARFLKPVGAFDVGDALPGRFDTVSGHLVTAVMTGQAKREGA